jgi:hypothetical protein
MLNRLTWKAAQYKLPTKFAFYFNDLSPELQQSLNKEIDKEVSGLPVLFFTKPTKEWTLICTQQVICNDTAQTIKLNIRDIKQILPTEFDPRLIGQPIDINAIKKKSEWDEIKVIDKENNCYIFHADKGNDLFSLWNILLMAKRFYD